VSETRPTATPDQVQRVRLGLGVAVVVLVAVAVVAMTIGDDDQRATTDGASVAGSASDAPGPSTTAVSTTERRPASTATAGSAPGTSTSGGTAGPGSTTAPPTSEAPTTTAPAGDCTPVEAIADWPLRRRLAALVMVGVDPSGTGEATEAVEDHHVGGLFVGGNPTGLLTSGALTDLRAASPTGLMVSVDEEGGRVQRIEGLDGEVPSAREMATSMSAEEVRALAERRARVMAAHGITVDLAPVVDVSDQPDGAVIGDRSWSNDPDVVVAYSRAYAEGLLAEGVTPVLKHFPGHGSSSGDTHDGSATTPSLDDLRSSDLVPYEALVPELGPRTGVMLGHLDVPGLTEPDTPTSLSPATVALLRDDYGFSGVIMTDDLSAMAAITDRFGVAEAAVRALAAGVDMVLFAGTDVGGLLDHLEGAVANGDLAEAALDASVARTLVLKGVDPCTAGL
jgi:beta-N-acetylhexosaminidase